MEEERPVAQPLPIKKRKPIKRVRIAATASRPLRIVVVHDVPLEKRTEAHIDYQNAGTERYASAAKAELNRSVDGTQLWIALKNRRYVCALLPEDEVRRRMASVRRAIDVAMWEPELFWNARYYKCIGL